MSKASVSGYEIRALLMQDEEYKNEYERLKPRYDLIAQIVNSSRSKK